MAGAAEKNRVAFIDAFNKAIGNASGKPMSYENTSVSAAGIPPETIAAVQNMLAKTVKSKAKSSLPKPKKITVPAINITPGQTAVSNASLLKSKINTSGLSGGPTGGGILHALTHNPITHLVGEEIVKPVSRDVLAPVVKPLIHPVEYVLDKVSRPAYAVAEGLKESVQHQNAGEPLWSLPDNFVHGAWEGFSGRKKTGIGQVINEAEKGGSAANYVEQQLQKAGQLTPEVKAQLDKRNTSNAAKWERRIAGGIGDVALDPTTYITGGAVLAKLGSKGKEVAAGAKGVDLIKGEVGRVTKDVLDDVGDSRIIAATRPVGKAVKGEARILAPVSDKIIKDVQDKLDNFIIDTKNGKTIGGTLKDSHSTVGHIIAESTRDEYFRQLAPIRNKVLTRLNSGKKFTDKELEQISKQSPIIKDWIDTLVREAPKTKISEPAKLLEFVDREFSKTLDPVINEIYGKAISKLDDITMRVPTISMMGHTHYMTSVGKYFDLLKKSPVGIRTNNLTKAFRYSSWFPEHTANIAAKVRSLNYERYDKFRKEVNQVFKDTTKEDRKLIHTAIQENRQLTGHLGDLQNYIKQQYKDLYWEEVAKGARNPNTTPFADNYVFNQIHNPGRSKNIDTEWRIPKKETVKKTGNLGKFTSMDAAKQGLRSETDAAQALLIRKTKSLRELSRVEFKKDLVTHYGISSRMAREDAKLQNLVPIDRKKFPNLYKDVKPGETLYIDKEIDDVYKKYLDLTSIRTTPESADLVRTFDRLTNLFKTANTIYFPGFHIRNLVSDIFMGAFDGVKSKDYEQIFKAMMKRESSHLPLAGGQMKFTDFLDSYYNNAASAGFFDTELNRFTRQSPNDFQTTGFMDALSPSNIKHVPTALRSLSTKREDFGRMVHYYHALNEEYAHQLSRGLSKERALRNAEEVSLSRVNKFKFDYNALTKTEQSIKRFGVPFYTYMRKAAPVLMEQLFMNPRYFSYINRLQQSLAPSEEFQGAQLPAWMKEAAFSQLTGGNEPLGFTDYLSPTRTLKESLSNPVIKANPLIQGPFEYATGKNIFTNKNLPTDKGARIAEILKSKYRGITTYRGIESDTKPTIEKWAGFFGIPLVKVTKARQAGKAYEIQQQVDQKVKDVNTKIQNLGMRVSIRKGKIYLIYPKSPSSFEKRYGFKPKYSLNAKEDVVGIYDKFSDIDFSKFKPLT